MKKLIMVYLLFVFMCSSFVIAYDVISKPTIQASSDLFTGKKNTAIELTNSEKVKTIDDNILSTIQQGDNIILFYTTSNSDSIFLLENIIPSIEKKYTLNDINIKLIDVSLLGEGFSIATTRNKWNFENTPTLTKVFYDGTNIDFIDKLTWGTNNSPTIKNVEDWLLEVKHLNSLDVLPKGDEIEKPLNKKD